MARRSGLGRGLGALIPTEVVHSTTSSFREIPLSRIRPNQYQPRKHFDEQALSSLVDSIKAVGVLQPVLVRALDLDDYELIAGERRFRAAHRAGLQAIPALVQEANDVSSLEQALVENLHREDLNPLEEAAAYQQLIEDFGLTHDDIARRVGRSRTTVTNTLRLFQLAPAVQRFVQDSELSPGHARALLMTPDRELQEELGALAIKETLSVRHLEELVRSRMAEPVVEATAPATSASKVVTHAAPSITSLPLRPPGVMELEEMLENYLNTRVNVDLRAKRGRVIVEFATIEDLERIFHLIVGEPST